MTNLLKELLQELKDQEAGTINKTAAAPNEPLSPEQQNADVLESSQAMLAKIDNFLQQVNGMGQDNSQETQDTQGTGGGVGNPGDPNDQGATGAPTVKLEVPAGMSVKLASCDPIDSESALRTIVGLVPSYFGE